MPILDKARNVTVESQTVYNEVNKLTKENQDNKDSTFASANELFNSLSARKCYESDVLINGIIKEFVRYSAPDALRIQLEGKVPEEKLTVGSYCKLDGQERVIRL